MQKAASLDQNDNEDADQAKANVEKDSKEDKEPQLPEGYNPRDYDHLVVSPELKSLFELINK